MTTIDSTDRTKVIHVRTNRHTAWKYSTYCGRYRTEEECLEAARDQFGNQPFEFQIWDMETGEVATGFVNWDKRVK